MLIEDVVCPPEHLADMTQDLIQLFRRHGYTGASACGHALDGNLHLVFAQVSIAGRQRSEGARQESVWGRREVGKGKGAWVQLQKGIRDDGVVLHVSPLCCALPYCPVPFHIPWCPNPPSLPLPLSPPNPPLPHHHPQGFRTPEEVATFGSLMADMADIVANKYQGSLKVGEGGRGRGEERGRGGGGGGGRQCWWQQGRLTDARCSTGQGAGRSHLLGAT
jgi:hypothetical protein